MELTAAELRAYDGSEEGKPIYVAVKGLLRSGGSYCMFAGRDASRALGKMSKSEEEVSGNLDGLTEKELGVLDDWEKKFQAKYPVVGRLV
ncbi:unnamed protein product [Spirodela intermedia]|uniref:Cytochrome b5 heme-binding domain-containing protein n=1 Tax=Spirodela intermedia TaxID=51605 RepID=A0A7I8JNH8_SPIIN|nr:unnamed protein product [Spirodela intermedia]CAA6671012.1 unnamed protein product [Spirodela intermedia]